MALDVEVAEAAWRDARDDSSTVSRMNAAVALIEAHLHAGETQAASWFAANLVDDDMQYRGDLEADITIATCNASPRRCRCRGCCRCRRPGHG